MAQHKGNSAANQRDGWQLPTSVAQLDSNWLAVTLHSIGDAVIATDSGGTVTFMNPVAEALTGWTTAEGVGQPLVTVFRIVNEQTRRPAESPVAQALREGAVVGLANHTLLIGRDGTEIAIDDSAAPIRDGGGNISGVVLVFRDVTEQRRAEQTQALLAAIVASSDDAIVSKTLEGEILSWNAGAEKLFGYTAAEAVGQSIRMIIPPELQSEEDEILGRLRRGETVEHYETVRVAKDGRRVDISLSVSPVRDDEGRIVGASKVALDITERKRAEQALRESDERFAQFMQNLPGLAWIKDLEGRYVYANDAAVEAFQRSRDELYGKTDDEVFPPETASQFKANDQQALEETGVQLIETLQHEDGIVHHSIVHKFPIPGPDGRNKLVGGVAIDITGQKHAERALRESEKRYRAIVESQVEMVCRFRPEGTILFVNGAYARARGAMPEDLVGVNLWNFVAREDRRDVRAMLERLSPEAPVVRIENRFETAEGTRWTLWTNRALAFDDNGRAAEIQSSGIDITDRKQAEAALQAKEAELQLVSETTPLILTRCSGDLKYRFANRAAAALFGLSPEQMIGKPIVDIMGEELFAIIKPRIDQVLRGEPVEFEAQLNYPGVGPRWVRANYLPECDERGEVQGWIASIVDVTKPKRLEQALKFLAEASKSLASLVDYKSTLQQVAGLAVPLFADWCAVDMLDEHGNLQRLAVAHVDPAKVESAHELYRRYPPDADAPRGVMHVLRTGQPELGTEISDDFIRQAARDDEHLRIMRELKLRSYICVPLRVQNKTFGVLTFVTAESGRRYAAEDMELAEDLARRAAIAIENARLYEEAREADRRKDEFLAMLAHELRNPLAPIQSGLDILAMAGNGDQETIGRIQEQVQHLVRLVDDLLDVSRIVRGNIELRKERVQLSVLINQSVEVVRPSIDANQQQLVVDLPEEAIWVNADPVRLLQVIENLLNNAVKYTDVGGRIELTVEQNDGQAVVSVRDNGMGIEPELLPNVFELFIQSSRTLDRAQGGLGIGLTLARRLVEMHDGTISVHSQGPGKGSTFTVRLPVVQPAEPSAAAADHPPVAGGRSILLVDDNVRAAELLAMLLSMLGDHQVEMAHDGVSALEKIKELHPEIVLLDIGLPGMDGYQVARAVRSLPEFNDVRLVALTGYGQEEDHNRSRQAGFDRHLIKPVKKAVLEEVLADLPQACR